MKGRTSAELTHGEKVDKGIEGQHAEPMITGKIVGQANVKLKRGICDPKNAEAVTEGRKEGGRAFSQEQTGIDGSGREEGGQPEGRSEKRRDPTR